MNEQEVFNTLAARNITKVVVCYSGGGDEGGVDEIEVHGAAGVTKMDEYYGMGVYDPVTQNYTKATPTAEEALSSALCKPVYDRYGGFAGEYYTSGSVIWDVASRKVTWK